MAKEKFFRFTDFKGITNKEVIELHNEIRAIKKEYEEKLKEKEDRLKKIQDDCAPHTFHFVAQGMHEDDYCCPKCGKEAEN